ncbi:ABC transporter permease (plasmid) [Variovorax sp. V213]
MNSIAISSDKGNDVTTPRKTSMASRLGLFAQPTILIGSALLVLIVLLGIGASLFASADPAAINPMVRNKPPGATITLVEPVNGLDSYTAVLGTDSLGRDIFSRIAHGTRASLTVGVAAAVISTCIGLFIGLLAGYVRWLDGIVMRVMDGLMAIPSVLFAIALVSMLRAGVASVVLAIVIPEIPRVVRLVRSYVLSLREEPYVEAAITVGTPTPLLLVRHMLPNLVPPLIVQSTFICASAILIEAYLSFLGIGIPPEIPTWGNVMAEGRNAFRLHPAGIFAPGIVLAITILSLNIVGDALRDSLDPKMAKR